MFQEWNEKELYYSFLYKPETIHILFQISLYDIIGKLESLNTYFYLFDFIPIISLPEFLVVCTAVAFKTMKS